MIAHMMFHEISLEQKGHVVLVTFTDGTTRRVLATLTEDNALEIIIAAKRPMMEYHSHQHGPKRQRIGA
jgi:hypothetical protein